MLFKTVYRRSVRPLVFVADGASTNADVAVRLKELWGVDHVWAGLPSSRFRDFKPLESREAVPWQKALLFSGGGPSKRGMKKHVPPHVPEHVILVQEREDAVAMAGIHPDTLQSEASTLTMFTAAPKSKVRFDLEENRTCEFDNRLAPKHVMALCASNSPPPTEASLESAGIAVRRAAVTPASPSLVDLFAAQKSTMSWIQLQRLRDMFAHLLDRHVRLQPVNGRHLLWEVGSDGFDGAWSLTPEGHAALIPAQPWVTVRSLMDQRRTRWVNIPPKLGQLLTYFNTTYE